MGSVYLSYNLCNTYIDVAVSYDGGSFMLILYFNFYISCYLTLLNVGS